MALRTGENASRKEDARFGAGAVVDWTCPARRRPFTHNFLLRFPLEREQMEADGYVVSTESGAGRGEGR